MERTGWTWNQLQDENPADVIDDLQDKWRAEAAAKRIVERRNGGR